MPIAMTLYDCAPKLGSHVTVVWLLQVLATDTLVGTHGTEEAKRSQKTQKDRE